MLGVAIANGVFTMPHLNKVQTFKHGDILDVPGMPMVLHTPGHTPGEVVFYLPDRGVLLSGDTVVTRNLMTGELGQPQITHALLSHNYEQAQESLDLLRGIGHVTILSGHGKPWTGSMSDAIDIALQENETESRGTEMTPINGSEDLVDLQSNELQSVSLFYKAFIITAQLTTLNYQKRIKKR